MAHYKFFHKPFKFRHHPCFAHLLILVLLTFHLAQLPTTISYAAEGKPAQKSVEALSKSLSQPQIDAILAGLSDEQVRGLLLTELKKKAVSEDEPVESSVINGPGAILSSILQTLSNRTEDSESQLINLWSALPNVIPDLKKVFITLCPYGTSHGAFVNVLWVILFISIGLVVETVMKKGIITRYFSFDFTSLPNMNLFEKILAGIVKELPDFLGLFIFFGSAFLSFFLFIGTDSPYVQLFFLAILIAISLTRAFSISSHILLSPTVLTFRVLPITCQAANKAHNYATWTVAYIISALLFTIVAKRLGAVQETVLLLRLFFASLLLVTSAVSVLIIKNKIKDHILQLSENGVISWGRRQFANVWHLLALLYLFVLWLLLLNDLCDPHVRNKGAFLLSFFVVPIWMVADRVMQWIVAHFMSTLKIHQQEYDPKIKPTEEDLLQREKGKELYLKVKGVARAGVVLALLIWVASLWNIRIPFFSGVAAVTLDTFIILTLTLFFWQFISSWIERKIQESIPEEEEDQDSEWGGAAARGRSYTLLPMIRKFIGSCLVVVVTMTVLSSMGVDIGPLLAGAGVIGLAIGFGAQKLVADIFSGFFYLLDDAFRVGEYLQAGTVSGTVESISLRNVMLRHHRGMLQIVPHSELGAITNYMRGGIIVKFNLDFPYDTDIDKVRKIIKKVGQAMLENEEYGKDFIRPVKSQGVREISNSVMTIRVKFTAQPGTHFVIRREAFKAITEALNAKGIHYAHKKVIVDLPQPANGTQPTPSQNQEQLKQAASAAAMRAVEEEEKEQIQPENNQGNGI
jgi:moderate conductance mechanosensitive channel